MDYIIIVAGGKGLRMGSDIPKQFLPIDGLPVLMRTIRRFREYDADINIILVLPKSQQEYWHSLCKEYQFNERYTIADGGETRFHSVSNGLSLVPDDAEGVVGVHDGVRPFPAIDVIANCYATARSQGAVIPVIPVVETVRHLEDNDSRTVARDEYRLKLLSLICWPRFFRRAIFKNNLRLRYIFDNRCVLSKQDQSCIGYTFIYYRTAIMKQLFL